MRNIKLILEYDGRMFHGWQKQVGLKTVQGELEEKLEVLLQERVRVVGAGRTDAGCHATCQVANFRTDTQSPLWRIAGGINGLMRGEMVVGEISEVPDGFSARYSALSRTYRYLLAQRPTALWRDRVWVVRAPLELDRMEKASRALEGRHSFSAFSKTSDRREKNPVCCVFRAEWSAWELGLAFEIEADRFLHGMVRMIVGTMVKVGSGRLPGSHLEAMLAGSAGCDAGPAAPARGLCLIHVRYEGGKGVTA